MKFILYLMHLFDNKKNRSYVSEADQFLRDFDKSNPHKSESQSKEVLKHKNIFKRQPKKKLGFLDS